MTDEAFVPSTGEWYYPSEEIVKNAHVPDYDAVYQEAMADIEGFWAKRAATLQPREEGAADAAKQRAAHPHGKLQLR